MIITSRTGCNVLGSYTEFYFDSGPLENIKYQLIGQLFDSELGERSSLAININQRLGRPSHSVIRLDNKPETTMLLIKHHSLIERISKATYLEIDDIKI